MPNKWLTKASKIQRQQKTCKLKLLKKGDIQTSRSESDTATCHRRQEAKSTPKDPGSCKKHGGRKYVKYCQKCLCTVCSLCIQKSHKKHQLEELSAIFEVERSQLVCDIEELQSKTSEVCVTNMNQLRTSRNEYAKAVKMIEVNMRKQANHIKKKTDKVLRKNLKVLHQYKANDEMMFQNQEEHLRQTTQNLDKTVKIYTKKLQSTRDKSELIQFMKTRSNPLQQEVNSSIVTEVSPPTYIPGKVDSKLIHRMNGQITKPTTTTTTKYPNIMVTAFLSCFSCDLDKLGTACTVQDRKIWVTFGTSQFIYLINDHGTVLKKLRIGIGISDLKVRQNGKLIITNKKEKCLQTFNPKGKLRELVHTEKWTPQGVCISQSQDYIVSMYVEENHRCSGKIVKYNQVGEKLMEITSNEDVELCHPHFVAEHPIGDIWITDRARRDPKVVVVDQTGKYRFCYRSKKNEVTGKFVPRGICIDGNGNVLIANTDNHTIEVLDKDGHFVTHLMTRFHEIRFPYILSIDTQGKLWIGEYESADIKVIKYSA